MSFDLTTEQRAFRDMMRSFVDARVAPHAAEYDKMCAEWDREPVTNRNELPPTGDDIPF